MDENPGERELKQHKLTYRKDYEQAAAGPITYTRLSVSQ